MIPVLNSILIGAGKSLARLIAFEARCVMGAFLFVRVLVLCGNDVQSAPAQLTSADWASFAFPDSQWERRAPEEAGFDSKRWNEYIAIVNRNSQGYPAEGQNPEGKFGCVIVRQGYLVAEIGDPDLMQNSASVGKAFNKLALQLALDRGIIECLDDRVSKYWIGRGLFDDPNKELDRGFHADLTWRHLVEMRGGFPISNGSKWISQTEIPDWAQWTGNPQADNRAHRRPGERHYSSGGLWRLNQALTAVIGKELKTFLDEELFSKMGIDPGRWTWESGRTLREHSNWYPDWPDYGKFCDPPYEIDGNRVQGGGGWVTMSPSDLARLGLLVCSRGQWNGVQLISDTDLLDGHAGFKPSISLMDGDPETGIAIGKVNWGASDPKITIEELNELLLERGDGL